MFKFSLSILMLSSLLSSYAMHNNPNNDTPGARHHLRPTTRVLNFGVDMTSTTNQTIQQWLALEVGIQHRAFENKWAAEELTMSTYKN